MCEAKFGGTYVASWKWADEPEQLSAGSFRVSLKARPEIDR